MPLSPLEECECSDQQGLSQTCKLSSVTSLLSFLPDLLSVALNTVVLNYYVCVALHICKAFHNHSLANHILSLSFKIYWALCAWHYVAYIITINNAIYCQALGTIQH